MIAELVMPWSPTFGLMGTGHSHIEVRNFTLDELIMFCGE